HILIVLIIQPVHGPVSAVDGHGIAVLREGNAAYLLDVCEGVVRTPVLRVVPAVIECQGTPPPAAEGGQERLRFDLRLRLGQGRCLPILHSGCVGEHLLDRAGAGIHCDGAGTAVLLSGPHIGQDAEDLILLPLLFRQTVGGGGQGVLRQAVDRLCPQALVQERGGPDALHLGDARLLRRAEAAAPALRSRGVVGTASGAPAAHLVLQLRQIQKRSCGGVYIKGVRIHRQIPEHGRRAARLPHVFQLQLQGVRQEFGSPVAAHRSGGRGDVSQEGVLRRGPVERPDPVVRRIHSDGIGQRRGQAVQQDHSGVAVAVPAQNIHAAGLFQLHALPLPQDLVQKVP
ncbi:type I glyceraldehyde-3-phosphate dehydrogenase, partial [Dysosmobacter welbionis]